MKNKILIVIVLLLSGCTKSKPMLAPAEVVFKVEEVVDVQSKIHLQDIIKETNAEIIGDNYLIDTTKVGQLKKEINYKFNGKEYIYEYEINVVDKVKPFIFGSTNLTLLKNNEKDLCESIAYGDNYDSKASCQIVGNYDASKIGSYDLKMVVTDSSGNSASKNVKVKIVEKTGGGGSATSSRLDFSTLKDKYPGDNLEYGLDISSWQEEVDYEAVKAAGVSFVMLRIGFQNGPAEVKMDKYFKENLQKAQQAGLKVGIYLYTNAKTREEIVYQHDWLMKELGSTKLDLPIAFDWENWSTFNKYNLSFYELNMLANEFIELVNASGYQGCLYSSKYYLENIWHEAKAHPVWLAHYTEQTSYQEEYFMWQLSSVGRIPGISGAVDLNILYPH